MQYDPIKRLLGKIFNSTPYLRVLFYKLLNLLLLRTWHIKKELRKLKKNFPEKAEVLDAGSGFGQYVYFLSSISSLWKIKGVDVKDEQVADCNYFFNKRGFKNVKFEIADLTKINYNNEYQAPVLQDVQYSAQIKSDIH